MKILNPTVFLDNGELKCLTVEVPKDLIGIENTIENRTRYEFKLAQAKSSAVKIKNSDEVLRLWYNEQFEDGPDPGGGKQLTFESFVRRLRDVLHTLTGYEAEVEYYKSDKDALVASGYSHPPEQYATISPAVKEESQEELWSDVVALVFINKAFPEDIVKELSEKFTVTRKV